VQDVDRIGGINGRRVKTKLFIEVEEMGLVENW